LSSLGALVERSLAEVRLAAGAPRFERIIVAELLEEIQISAAMQAEGYGVELACDVVDGDAAIDADRQLLASAVSNLVENALKFSQAHGIVSLTSRATADRVLIEVADACGGLPPGMLEDPFRPFAPGTSKRSGSGLGLSIALSAAKANAGNLSVRDVPGIGCVFTLDLPRRTPPPAKLLRVGGVGNAD
jgi:signal transduction histidine kinase